ncbi:hypothetical protein WJX81_005766 [Elliptochloris bilobata]|uniref:CDP-diacylglycerol--glycerol-3-phosphate 3-phosphatidyltransferase n=1 Tax=Elliptochloris bilobata TaxID=381761 RepID=A0AAW1RAY0_9CHLO
MRGLLPASARWKGVCTRMRSQQRCFQAACSPSVSFAVGLPTAENISNASRKRGVLVWWRQHASPASCRTAARRDLLNICSPASCTGWEEERQRYVRAGHGRRRRLGRVRALAAERAGASSAHEPAMVLTLPTMLTLARVAAIPVLFAVWFSGSPHAPLACSAIFVAAAVTDFLDGYLARSMGTMSTFGAFLDPVADKLMVAAVLVLVASRPLAAGPLAGNAWLTPALAIVIVGREVAMSALRELAAARGGAAYSAVAVSAWGKWKTATQMAALTLMLAASGGGSTPSVQAAAWAGPPLLCVAAILSVASLAAYLRALWKYL